MAIHLPKAPPEGLEAVRRDAPAMLNVAPGDTAMHEMAEAVPQLSVSEPHRVFSASIDDVLADAVLANARETTWRYFLVHGGNEPFATAEVTGNELSHVNEGPFVQGTASAMSAAEEHVAASHRDYELRLLRIPALYTVAVWLHAPDDDLLIPAAPAPRPLVANQAYAEADFTGALRSLAETRNAADERA